MAFEPKYTITDAIAVSLTTIERARGFLEAARLSEDWIAGMQRRALLLEAHYTTHIEGTHLTLDQSERLLSGNAVPEASPDDARELLNYRDAFELVAGYLGSATLSRILNGWHKPSQKTKYRIMQRYGVDENYNPLIASLATDPLLSLSPDPAAIPLSALPPEVRKTVTHYDVIQGPPGVTIYVNPDVPLAQRRMALEMAAEMQRKVKEAKGKE